MHSVLESAGNTPAIKPLETLVRFNGFGDITIKAGKERFHGKFDVSLRDTNQFCCDIYSPLAQTLATITASAESVTVEFQNQTYAFHLFDTVSQIPFLANYSFNFSDLIRILTGRLLKQELFYSDADTIKKYRGKTEYQWKSEQYRLEMVVDNRKGGKIKQICYSTTLKPSWHIFWRSFRNGLFKELYFMGGENNYFLISFEKMSIL